MDAHARWEGMMSAHFAGKLAPADAAALAGHARECPSCDRTYQRFAAAERALEGDARPLTWGAQDRVAARLFGAAPARQPVRSWAFAGTLAAAATAMAVIALAPRLGDSAAVSPSTSEAFYARGVPARGAGLGLRALGLRADVRGDLAVSDLESGGARLAAGDHLRVLYTNLGGAERAEITVTLAGRALDVLPARVELAAGVEDAPLGDPIAVPPDWHGRLVVHARFLAAAGPVERELAVEVP